MQNQVLNIKGVDVLFFRSTRAKRLNITIKPFIGVRVSIPYFVSIETAQEIAEKRIVWIRSNLLKIRKIEDQLTIFDLDTDFQTRYHRLSIQSCKSHSFSFVVRNNQISINVPEKLKISDSNIQIKIRKVIEFTLRSEAEKHLPDRIKLLADKYDFEYNNVTIKNSKNRWGSCSFDNNINLNLHLMRLPDHLVDYVILHELVHTKIKNHSKDFWKLLDIVSGNARKLDREVKLYQIKIY